MEQGSIPTPVESITATTAPGRSDVSSRVAAVRQRLPGQLLRERLDTARLLYGPLYTQVEIRQRVAETLPQRFGFVRTARLEPIERYGERIPDEALLKYDDAAQSQLFSRFWVATPIYNRWQQSDPWIIGEVSGSELCAVVAQWDV